MARGASAKVGQDFTTGPILKQLITFAVPMILSGLLQQLYSAIDLVVVGQYVGSIGTVGVSTGGEIADIMLPIASALSMGAQIYIAQLLGARMHDGVKKLVGSMITAMLLISVAASIFIVAFHVPLLQALNCPVEAFEQARAYMVITAFGTPFVFVYNAICGMLRGFGESKRPLLFVAIASVVNLVLNLIFVVFFRMESAGVAIATVFAQAASCIASLIYMIKKKDTFDFELKLTYFKIDKEAMRVVLSLGIPQALRSFLVRFSGLWVRAQINSYGLIYSATNSVGNKVEKFAEIYSNSMSHSSGAMIGQNLGAKKHDRAKYVVFCTLYLSLGVAALIIAAAWLIPGQIFGLFTNDVMVQNMGKTYMKIMTFQYLLTAVVNAFQAMVIASGNAKLNFVIGIVDGIICKVGLGILFVSVFMMGAEGYWWGITLSRFVPMLICIFYYRSGKWKEADLTKVHTRGSGYGARKKAEF